MCEQAKQSTQCAQNETNAQSEVHSDGLTKNHIAPQNDLCRQVLDYQNNQEEQQNTIKEELKKSNAQFLSNLQLNMVDFEEDITSSLINPMHEPDVCKSNLNGQGMYTNRLDTIEEESSRLINESHESVILNSDQNGEINPNHDAAVSKESFISDLDPASLNPNTNRVLTSDEQMEQDEAIENIMNDPSIEDIIQEDEKEMTNLQIQVDELNEAIQSIALDDSNKQMDDSTQPRRSQRMAASYKVNKLWSKK